MSAHREWARHIRRARSGPCLHRRAYAAPLARIPRARRQPPRVHVSCIVGACGSFQRGVALSPSPNTPMVPLAIIGTGCLFPGSADFRAFWSRIVNRYDAIREVPPSHWNAADYLDADPKAPDRVYAARGGFLDPVAVRARRRSASRRATSRRPTPANCSASSSPSRRSKDCGYAIAGRDKPAAPSRPSSGRASASSSASPARSSSSSRSGRAWAIRCGRRRCAEAGVDDDTADDVVARIADGYVPWQENSFPGLLGNVVAGPDRQPLRPGRDELRRRCRLRLVAQRHPPRRDGAGHRAGPTSC